MKGTLFAAAVVALLPAGAGAQSLTGSLAGTVKDPQGGVLAGAIVYVTSPALIEREEQTTSNEKGQWRFPILPPGRYTLRVDLPPGFAPYRIEQLLIRADETVEVPIVLELAGVAEAVTVTGDSSIAARASGLETRFDTDYLRTIPSRRFSMFDVIKSAPGVSPTSPSSGTVNTVSVFGSAVNENAFLIDGTNFTCPCQGVARAEPIVDAIQEVDVLSAGASVEYGNIQGGVVNVVTRAGSATFTGDFSYYAQFSALTSQPVVLSVPDGTQPLSGYERDGYRDFTTGVGGPIAPHRVWFYGAYQYLRDFDSQPGTDPAFPRRYEQNKVLAKLTSRLTPSLHLMSSFHVENWQDPTPPTLAAPFVTTQRSHASVPSMTFFHVTHVLSNTTVWEARVGRFIQHEYDDPSSGDRTTPPHTDVITGGSSGNTDQIDALVLDRLTAKAFVDRYQASRLGEHHVRAGLQIERGEHRLRQIIPGGVQFIDNDGAPFQAVYRAPSISGGRSVTAALFASDSVGIGTRVHVDGGLRFDHSRAVSQDLPVVDAEGHETHTVTEGLGTLYTWNVLSPRVGVILKLDSNGRTLLRGGYGRFNQGVLTGELDAISPGVAPTTTMAYDDATGDYTRFVSAVDPTANLSLDPHTRTPHTDEYSVAVDRQFPSLLRVSAAYVVKRGGDFIGWTDTGGTYRLTARTLADGTVLPVFELTNDTDSRRFVLTNPDPLFVHYDGLVLAVERQPSRQWQASASYTFSRAYGVQVISNGPPDAAQFSTIARLNLLTFGQDPNHYTNAAGRLPNDRPHVFRGTTAVRLPWGFRAAANLQRFSGKPWAATARVNLPQGSQRILLEPRGSRRLSAQSLLDLRLAKVFRDGANPRVELTADVLNALNDAAEEALTSDVRSSPTFGQPTRFVDPRRAMLGIRVTFGERGGTE